MKKASIIAVGTELMQGKMDDSNSTFLSRWLFEAGIEVRQRFCAADRLEDIIECCRTAAESDLILLTGGLGPTDDDLTREAVAAYLEKELYFSEEAWKEVIRFFELYKREIAESNKRQAYTIEGAKCLKNELGTAPGIYYKGDRQTIVLLPGPPRENQKMVTGYLAPLLEADGFTVGHCFKEVYRIYGIGESTMSDLFNGLESGVVDIGYYHTRDGWIELHFTRLLTTPEPPEEVRAEINRFLAILEEKGILYTENESLSQLVLNRLKAKGLTISFAESITGGGLSAALVKHSGASTIFPGGIVSYSNELKRELLEVKESSLAKYGAVSGQVAGEMAFGLKALTGTDIAVSISGIAGPGGATETKPVGLVYMGFSMGGNLKVKKEIFPGSRDRVITRAVHYVYGELFRYLESC